MACVYMYFIIKFITVDNTFKWKEKLYVKPTSIILTLQIKYTRTEVFILLESHLGIHSDISHKSRGIWRLVEN